MSLLKMKGPLTLQLQREGGYNDTTVWTWNVIVVHLHSGTVPERGCSQREIKLSAIRGAIKMSLNNTRAYVHIMELENNNKIAIKLHGFMGFIHFVSI